MNKQEIIEKVTNTVKEILESKDNTATWWVDLGYFNDNRWAVVMAYIDFEDGSTTSVQGYVGYKPVNSYMSEYHFDWLMPTDPETEEVDDTETTLAIDNVNEASVVWLVEQWENRIKDFAEHFDEEGE